MNFQVRAASKKELDIMIEWATKEGWNPGIHDGDAFYATDPTGFLLGFLDDEPIASISSVAYDNSFGFLGFYIVKPEYRGKGYGIQIWNEAIKHLPAQNIGLDGVLAQQENYKKSGFTFAHRNIRYQGFGISAVIDNSNLTNLSDVPFELLIQYDKQVFPTDRPVFLKEWIRQPENFAVAYLKDSVLMGYGVVRRCRVGFKVGPLFADNDQIADILFQRLRSFAKEDNQIFLDTPEINSAVVGLAERYKMKPMFETARMYTKHEPKVALEKIYGITTFELG